MYRVANDGRYAERSARVRVASQMFALLPLLADRHLIIDEWSDAARRRAAMCAIWLLGAVEPEQLSRWWRTESVARRCGVLALLRTAVIAFKLPDEVGDTGANDDDGNPEDLSKSTKQAIEGFYGQDPHQKRRVIILYLFIILPVL